MADQSTRGAAPSRSRRNLLIGVAAAALATALPGGRSAVAALPTRRLSMAVLGRRYLAQHPEERAVVRGLAAGLRALSAGAIRAQVAADFRHGDVVDLGGWRLARTECRLGALAALA